MSAEQLTTLVVEKEGRLLITCHAEPAEALEKLRSYLRPADRHLEGEELLEMAYSSDYGYGVSIDTHEVPEGAGGRLAVMVVESEDGVGVTIHSDAQAARHDLAERLGIEAGRELMGQAEEMGYSARIVLVAAPR